MDDRLKKGVDLAIPNFPDMEIAAAETAEAVGNFIGLDKDKTQEVKMSLIEACINAFEHSEGEGPVHIHFEIADDALTVQVTDTGGGFNTEEAKQQSKDRRESRRGWGLKIMEELMDDVNIESTEKGTVITMVKKR